MSDEYIMINELFKKYKDLTLQMIENFGEDVNIEGMMGERQDLLEKINEVKIPGKDKKKVYESMEIDKLDKKLEEILKKALNDVKNDIKINKLRRQTTNSYNNAFAQQNIFSRRV